MFRGTIDPQIEVGIDFAGYSDGQIAEIQIDGHSTFDASYRHGTVCFLVSRGELAGIRVEGLSRAELRNFTSFQRRPSNGRLGPMQP